VESVSYQFALGDFECIAVSDGSHTYAPPDFPPPPAMLFANAPGENVEAISRQYGLPSPWLEWVSPYICLVVRTSEHLILVDTGAGNLAPTTGQLIKNLRAVNISPEDIDIVINTHGHPDHLGGNVDAAGAPVFPKASYIITKEEWGFWASDRAERELAEHSKEILLNTARRNLLPIKDRLRLIEPETEIVSGIKALPAPGHTPGQMALSITSSNERLLCLSDVVLHPVHLEQIDWCSIFDVMPEVVTGTRRRLLDMASTAKDLVMAFHFPFPGLGRVVWEGRSWRWQPEETAHLA
jgi:glyoxylase-like metal-dependent hydrolase (beta-lactamase superfamily II)